MNAVKGLFTYVSGSLPSESYEINTPTVSISVRGTKFDLFVSRKGASTVILRRGAIDVKNRVGGVTRRISKKGLATTVSTRRSDPTPPAPPSPELERLFKPLSDPRELQVHTPGKTNVVRESVEEESSRQRKQALLDLGGVEARGPMKDLTKDVEDIAQDMLDLKNPETPGNQKKSIKKPSIEAMKASAEARMVRKAAAETKKASAGARKSIKKASKGAKKSIKKASKGAKKSIKKVSRNSK